MIGRRGARRRASSVAGAREMGALSDAPENVRVESRANNKAELALSFGSGCARSPLPSALPDVGGRDRDAPRWCGERLRF